MKVQQLVSESSGRAVANQFIIFGFQHDGQVGRAFQSYGTIIAFRPSSGDSIVLDRKAWDYSTTTGKYRNQFLGEKKAETLKKIKSGEYILADLN